MSVGGRKWVGIALCSSVIACRQPVAASDADLGSFLGTDETPPATPAPPALPMIGAHCGAATPVADGSVLKNQTNDVPDALGTLCALQSDSGSAYYSATVPSGYRLIVTVTPTDGGFDPVVRVLTSCTSVECEARADWTREGEPETALYTNTGATAADVIIAVSGYAPASGSFDLEVGIAPFPANAVCSGATAVDNGTVLHDQDTSIGGPAPYSCLPLAQGGARYYSIKLPPRTRLTAIATPTGPWDPSVALLDGCGWISCAESADAGAEGEAETLRYENKAFSDRDLLLVVSASPPDATGTFDLSIEMTDLPLPAANAVCAKAKPIADGTVIHDENAEWGIDVPKCSPGGGGVLYYSAIVPPKHRLRVSATPTGAVAWDPVLTALPICYGNVCLDTATLPAEGITTTLGHTNTGNTPESVLVAVGAYSATTTGTFDLRSTITPADVNITCDAAQPVAAGTVLPSEDAILATTSQSSLCLPSAGGSVLYYSITIPADKSLQVDAVPLDDWWGNPAIRVFSDCAATTCLASSDAFSYGESEHLIYPNTTGAPLRVVFTIGDATASLLSCQYSVGVSLL